MSLSVSQAIGMPLKPFNAKLKYLSMGRISIRVDSNLLLVNYEMAQGFPHKCAHKLQIYLHIPAYANSAKLSFNNIIIKWNVTYKSGQFRRYPMYN